MRKLIPYTLLALFAITIVAMEAGKKQCPPEGSANPKKGKHAELKPREKNLNLHMNRETLPQSSDFEKTVGIEDFYNSKDDSIFSEDKAATLTGYIFRASTNGMESCNCFTEDKNEYSTNVYLSPNPLTAETRLADCIVTVITPYSRSLHPDWTTDFFNYKMVGKKVKVSGWMIYNYLKGNLSVETNSNGTQPERRTIWGLCPVTGLEELK